MDHFASWAKLIGSPRYIWRMVSKDSMSLGDSILCLGRLAKMSATTSCTCISLSPAHKKGSRWKNVAKSSPSSLVWRKKYCQSASYNTILSWPTTGHWKQFFEHAVYTRWQPFLSSSFIQSLLKCQAHGAAKRLRWLPDSVPPGPDPLPLSASYVQWLCRLTCYSFYSIRAVVSNKIIAHWRTAAAGWLHSPQAASSHPVHIKCFHCIGVDTTQLFSPPPVALEASSTAVPSSIAPALPFIAAEVIDPCSPLIHCQFCSTRTPLPPCALTATIPSRSGCAPTFGERAKHSIAGPR